MKFAVTVVPMLGLAAVLGLGCSNEKPKPVTSALDVGGDAAAAATTPAPKPVESRPPAALSTPSRKATAPAKRPAVVQPPVESVAAESAVPTKPAAPTTYVVQKGDTLFGIAKSQYGDGNKWKKIADANPGLSPNTLKVGQKIVVPPM